MCIRDSDDAIYKTKREKMNAVVEDIIKSHEKGQPVLVGTITIEMSEELSAMPVSYTHLDVYKRQS